MNKRRSIMSTEHVLTGSVSFIGLNKGERYSRYEIRRAVRADFEAEIYFDNFLDRRNGSVEGHQIVNEAGQLLGFIVQGSLRNEQVIELLAAHYRCDQNNFAFVKPSK